MDEKDKKELEGMFKRHVGILVEEFQHRIDIVVEGHQMLNEKFDRMQGDLTDIKGRVDTIDLRVIRLEQGQARLEQRQEGMEQRQEKMEQRQERMEQRQERMEQRMEGMEQGQERMEQRMEGLEQGQERMEQGQGSLEDRQERLEKEVKQLGVDLGKKIDNIASELAEHRADTEVHKMGYRIGDNSY